MNEEQRAAYINAQAACAMIEAMGMFCENMERTRRGETQTYGEGSFHNVIERYGIHHNAVIGFFRE